MYYYYYHYHYLRKNLWIDLRRAVHARRSKTLTALEAFFKEEWEKILQTGTERLLAGYKKLLQAVILAKGVVTKC